jgi:hypothetical protein
VPEGGDIGTEPRPSGERPELERHEPGDRCLGRHLDQLVEVGAVEQVEAGDELLGLHERAVGDQRLAVAHPHRDRCVWQVQRPARQPQAAALHLLDIAGDLALHDCHVRPGWQAVRPDKGHVLHRSS